MSGGAGSGVDGLSRSIASAARAVESEAWPRGEAATTRAERDRERSTPARRHGRRCERSRLNRSTATRHRGGRGRGRATRWRRSCFVKLQGEARLLLG